MKPQKFFLHSQLKAASEIWDEIRNTSTPADRWLGGYFHKNRKRFGSRDRRFLAETIYALLRHRSLIEVWAQSFGEEKNPHFLVLLAAASEEFLSREEFQEQIASHFPKIKNSGIFYEAFNKRTLPESLHPESGEEEFSLRFSFPRWIVRRWLQRFGLEECRQLLSVCQTRPPLVIRVNSIKITRASLIERLKQKGWDVFETKGSPFGIVFPERINVFDTDEFREGFFEIQDEGSQKVGELVDAKPGEIIWDICAGGGGKSLLMAAMMRNKGRIIATDIRPKKLEDLAKRARRAGVMNIFPANLERMSESREVRKGFDKILVDAPCSGTGTLRRNPDAKWKLDESQLKAYHQDQAAIIEKALPYLKKTGRLYYATCSLEPEENEEVMAEIIQKHPELEPVPCGSQGELYFKLLPHQDSTDGFFLAAVENK